MKVISKYSPLEGGQGGVVRDMRAGIFIHTKNTPLTPLKGGISSKRTQRREDAKNPQSFSLRNLCAFASLREAFCFLITMLALFSTNDSAFSQTSSPVSVESRIDKTSITIGDTVRYHVRLMRAPNVQVRWPGLAANLGAFEIRDYDKPEPREEKESIIEEVAYTISTFDTGTFVIPPLALQYLAPPDTAWRQLETERLEIRVNSVLPSEAGDIRDVKAPWELPRDWRTIILISAIAAAVLLLAGLGYYWWRRRQGKGLLPQREEPKRPAHELAFEELQQLRASDLLQRGEVKAFYSILSEIVRRYIEGRYEVMALEMTTYEVNQALRKVESNLNACDEAREILEASDLVKFAKLIPPIEQGETLINRAEAFVETTKPIVVAVANNGAMPTPAEQTQVAAEAK